MYQTDFQITNFNNQALQIINFATLLALMILTKERSHVFYLWLSLHIFYVSGNQNIYQYSLFLLILINVKQGNIPYLEKGVLLSVLAEVYFYRTDHERDQTQVQLTNAIGAWSNNFMPIQALNILFNSVGVRYLLPFFFLLT